MCLKSYRRQSLIVKENVKAAEILMCQVCTRLYLQGIDALELAWEEKRHLVNKP